MLFLNTSYSFSDCINPDNPKIEYSIIFLFSKFFNFKFSFATSIENKKNKFIIKNIEKYIFTILLGIKR